MSSIASLSLPEAFEDVLAGVLAEALDDEVWFGRTIPFMLLYPLLIFYHLICIA